MLLLSAAARLLPPAAPLSALVTCQSHHTQAPNIPDFDGAQKAAAWVAAAPAINAAAISADRDDSVLLEGESDGNN